MTTNQCKYWFFRQQFSKYRRLNEIHAKFKLYMHFNTNVTSNYWIFIQQFNKYRAFKSVQPKYLFDLCTLILSN